MPKPKKKPKKKAKKKTASQKKYEKNSKIIKKCEKMLKDKCVPEDKYDCLFKKILLNTNKLWLSDENIKQQDIITNKNNGKEYSSHSWFNITEYTPTDKKDNFNANIDTPLIDELFKCKKIKMYPSTLQKQLLLNWMQTYNKMYNATIKLFKKAKYDNVKLTINWKELRTYHLKDKKDKLIKKSDLKIKDKNGNNINTCVNSHVLDFAIQDACAKYKSCLSNLKNGNIKYFRLRYLKQNKDSLIMKIEKSSINSTKNTFCSTIFKDSFKLQDNFKLKDITCDFTIHYNQKTDEFQLLNPIKIKQELNNNTDSCGIDPGIRTFVSVFSNKKCVKIGDNLINKISKYLRKIDNNKRSNKQSKLKSKLERKFYKKINNIVDDLHWKTANYLTKNFNSVLIGNLSTKSIISNKLNNQLSDNIKRVSQHMSLHKFKMRLEYKCSQKNVGFIEVDEAYSTMTCTRCCYKNDVKKKKEIKCNFCQLIIDRDFNGARNILLRGTNQV